MDKNTFSQLARHRSEPSLSLYLPIIAAGREARQNVIRFRNLLGDAREKLKLAGLSEAEAGEFLAELHTMETDPTFWQQQDAGLALLKSRTELHRLRIPYQVEETVSVAEGYHVLPLLPLATEDSEFFILGLSKNRVRLYRASRFGEEEVEVEGMPQSEAEALNLDHPGRNLQHHGVGNGASSRGKDGILHGQGGGRDTHPQQDGHFCEILNGKLTPFLYQHNLPLVVVALGDLLSSFDRHCRYAHRLMPGIEGDPEALAPDQLRSRAWSKISSVIEEKRKDALSQAEKKISLDQATVDKEQALVAAKEGRAAAAFVAMDRSLWANQSANGANGEPHLHRLDLLNEIARHTVMHGGDVYGFPIERLPRREPVVVMLRY